MKDNQKVLHNLWYQHHGKVGSSASRTTTLEQKIQVCFFDKALENFTEVVLFLTMGLRIAINNHVTEKKRGSRHANRCIDLFFKLYIVAPVLVFLVELPCSLFLVF